MPRFIFYGFSRGIAWLLAHGIRYRRRVIEENLRKCFPHLQLHNIQRIKKEFYGHLADQFLEMLWMGSGTYEEVRRNYEIDVSGLNALYEEGRSVLMVLGHQFNWEWGLWVLSKETPFHVQGVYMPVKNRAIDSWLSRIRGRYGAEMVRADQVRTLLSPPTSKPTLTLIIGDQSPSNLNHCIWLEFLHQKTAFINSYEKIAQKRKMAVVFIEVIKKGKGKYWTPYQIFSKDASRLKKNELVEAFVRFLEGSIRRHPDNWLWSHRRWKHQPKAEPGDVS